MTLGLERTLVTGDQMLQIPRIHLWIDGFVLGKILAGQVTGVIRVEEIEMLLGRDVAVVHVPEPAVSCRAENVT